MAAPDLPAHTWSKGGGTPSPEAIVTLDRGEPAEIQPVADDAHIR
jgi:hypothetical protein